MLGRTRRIHFVGIGGIGMSGIAELLANLGYEVSGSDARRSTVTDRLEQLGVRVSVGHDAAHVGRADVVVVTSAIKSGNPETIEAVRRQIPVIPRAEMLAELMRLRYGIAIAGAHGKTSTTSMVALVLERAGLDPTAVIGGRLSAFGSNARLGRGEYMVVEADESDRSFLKLSPSIAVITNIDHEHMESYGSWADLQQAFVEFANKVPFYGAVIACADDEPVRNVLPRITRRLITYGLATADGQASASVTAHGMTLEAFGSRATVRYWTPESGSSASRAGELDHAGHQGLDHGGHQDLDHGGHQDLDHGGHQDLDHGGHQDLDHGGHQDDVELGELRLQVPGRHNLLNALAAVAAGLEVGIPFETIAAALAEFQGAERRFQRLGEEDGVMVVDDYGHHPTEIAAVLAAARAGIDRRVIVVFQPHRYSRTSQLLHEFGAALSAADEVVLTDIYAAGEPPIPGVTLEALALVVRQAARGGVRVVPALDDLPAAVATMTRPGDLVITLGAGSIGGIGERILEAIRHRRAQPASAGRTR